MVALTAMVCNFDFRLHNVDPPARQFVAGLGNGFPLTTLEEFLRRRRSWVRRPALNRCSGVSARSIAARGPRGLDSFLRISSSFLARIGAPQDRLGSTAELWEDKQQRFGLVASRSASANNAEPSDGEQQSNYWVAGIRRYEVIVVDDGSTDGTVEFLTTVLDREGTNSRLERACQSSFQDGISGMGGDDLSLQQSARFPHVKLVRQKHSGATRARNLGLKYASGSVIVFIDSDLVVTESFLKAHGEVLRDAVLEDGDDRAFSYGRVVNTSNFQNPQAEKVKITDYSAAFFATGNVAIHRRRLLEAGKVLGCDREGPFDPDFSEYGWEDLELGERLRQCGARIKNAPAAVGYHWHPAFSVEQLPKLIEQEWQRGRNGVHFYRKHPNLNVRLMIQKTPFHECLWFLLTFGGLLNEVTLEPILRRLVLSGRYRIAAALVSPILNWHTVQAVKQESRKLNV